MAPDNLEPKINILSGEGTIISFDFSVLERLLLIRKNSISDIIPHNKEKYIVIGVTLF